MNNQPLLKTALKYGAIAGLGNFVFFLLIYFMGKNPMGNWSWAGIWITIVVLVLGTKYHRNNDLGGYMTYGRGLGIGMLIIGFNAFLFALLAYSFGNFIDASIPQMVINDFMEGMEKARKFLGEDKYQTIMDAYEKNKDQFNMSRIAIGDFEAKVIGGFIVCLITAGIFARKRPMFEQPTSDSAINS
jgi:hypothetical protein